MLFDSVAFKNVVVNGLVLDKDGNKMSKRLGNSINPVELIDKYGIDVIRWYMVASSNPWENLKFDVDESGKIAVAGGSIGHIPFPGPLAKLPASVMRSLVKDGPELKSLELIKTAKIEKGQVTLRLEK